ncbi:unnamed protein product [Polarella glacialis]|uniref:Hexosyltransferase n=1 Tax=Polarella glacialis TaxID=89957 RepID=A0A813I1N1_POLGL|nr:unnamed protein product [Polarella glacialis]CAE8675755.1 unnamed protein product [Polarella glacialis]
MPRLLQIDVPVVTALLLLIVGCVAAAAPAAETCAAGRAHLDAEVHDEVGHTYAGDTSCFLQTRRLEIPEATSSVGDASCKERQNEFQRAFEMVDLPAAHDPCRTGKERCFISFALFCPGGKCSEVYSGGVLLNIKFAREIYPGWRVRIYTDGSLPAELSQQISSDTSEEVIVRGVQGNIAGMFWCFFATHDPKVDRVIIRDIDSLVNLRERATVNEWIRSGKKWHAIRDHPNHIVPLLGGMWGVMRKEGEEAAIPKSVIEGPARRGELAHYMMRKGGDQDFLAARVLPLATDLISHVSYFCNRFRPESTKPIPLPRRGPRDVIGYPNSYLEEDTLYQCNKTSQELMQSMAKGLTPLCRFNKDWTW